MQTNKHTYMREGMIVEQRRKQRLSRRRCPRTRRCTVGIGRGLNRFRTVCSGLSCCLQRQDPATDVAITEKQMVILREKGWLRIVRVLWCLVGLSSDVAGDRNGDGGLGSGGGTPRSHAARPARLSGYVSESFSEGSVANWTVFPVHCNTRVALVRCLTCDCLSHVSISVFAVTRFVPQMVSVQCF